MGREQVAEMRRARVLRAMAEAVVNRSAPTAEHEPRHLGASLPR